MKKSEVKLKAEELEDFLSERKTPCEYRTFVEGVFKDKLKIVPLDPVWNLLSYLKKESDYYTAPASTRYHGAEEGGLVRHSISVFAYSVKLAPVMLKKKYDFYYLAIAALFHDLCKVNMYETKSRNVKNEKTGKWESIPCYAVRSDYLALGHGIESCRRIGRFLTLPAAWEHAVRWHMGAYDLTEQDSYSMRKALSVFREVLLLQTADMLASISDGV